jgi:hypothetical protein
MPVKHALTCGNKIEGREKENETSKHKGFQRSGGGE